MMKVLVLVLIASIVAPFSAVSAVFIYERYAVSRTVTITECANTKYEKYSSCRSWKESR